LLDHLLFFGRRRNIFWRWRRRWRRRREWRWDEYLYDWGFFAFRRRRGAFREHDEIDDSSDEEGSYDSSDQATLGAAFFFEIVFFIYGHDGRLFSGLGGETDLIDLQASENIEDIHDALVLGGAVSADDDWDVRSGGFDDSKFALKFSKSDRECVKGYFALVADRDSLHFRCTEIGSSTLACAWKIYFYALDTSGGHDDEDEK
jgi:hypothetical protein